MSSSGGGATALIRGSAYIDCIHPHLAEVERHLARATSSDVPVMHALGDQVLSAGGKRLRPVMTVLSALAVNPSVDTHRVTAVAAALELIHMATLVHDDVVDHTGMRRGKPTANAVYGNGIAVITGDFLLARAMRLFASDGNIRVIRMMSDVTVTMSEGEVMEALATGDQSLSEARYREILRRKTAVFIEGCCRCGAVLADADDAEENALALYGAHVGMAFQITDDLLDYTGDPAVTGKPIGSDLREGRPTLPFLVAKERACAEDRARLLSAFGCQDASEDEIAEVLAAIERTGAYDITRSAACAESRHAIDAIEGLPPSPARDELRTLAAYVVERDR